MTVNIVPCSIFGRRAFILRTAANDEGRGHHPSTIIEIATDVKLRDTYRLQDGDLVEVEIAGGGGPVVSQHIACVAIIVRDYDEAINWYCRILGFTIVEDTQLTETKRWVRIAPAGSTGVNLVLARAATPEQGSRIGDQTGGRVFLFLNTDDFWRDYNSLSGKGVVFRRPPVEEQYGTVAVFEDIYGNLWDLIEPRIPA